MRFVLLCAAVLTCATPAWAEPAAPETVTVLVAKTDIPAGVPLKDPETLFKRVRYLKGEEPRDAVLSFDQLKGKAMRRGLVEDQPLKTGDLGEPAKALFVPPGMRAVAIKVPHSEANAFLLPGTRVDVLVTRRTAKNDVESRVVVPNVLLLAFDAGPAAEVVTLALKPEQAVLLAREAPATLSVVVHPPGAK